MTDGPSSPEERRRAQRFLLVVAVPLLVFSAYNVWNVLTHGTTEDLEAMDRQATDPSGP